MGVTLRPSIPSPSPVGTVVKWSAELKEGPDGTNWYCYRVRAPGASKFRTIRDFSSQPDFSWASNLAEGSYDIEVTVRNRESGMSVSATSTYLVTSRVTNAQPTVTPTAHPLVFLYSAPACAVGSRMRVQFDAPDGFRQFTPYMSCSGDKSENVYIAGLRAATEYRLRHLIRTETATEEGPELTFQTPSLAISPAITRVLQKSESRVRQGVMLQSNVFQYTVATDSDGRLIWFYPIEVQYLTRPEPGGYFFALSSITGAGDSGQLLQQIDLAGNVVLETNAARINEQLDAMGKRRITSFHHEARRMPNDKILVLAGTEQIFFDTQGPGAVDVIGDMILVLNRNLEVEWTWDAFDHLDVRRKAVLDEKCVQGAGGCPVSNLAPVANDWLHGNSLQLTPDSNILYSSRHQDWIIKIDYANGTGGGLILWRLGKDGDFTANSDDPSPWFSHQHDANFDSEAGELILFDNGNTRHASDSDVHSRGQVLQVNEENLTVDWLLNVDLGAYSLALGSAQKLNNGNYHFDAGWLPTGFSQALEFDSTGKLIYQAETETQQYRSFRMRDLYTP